VANQILFCHLRAAYQEALRHARRVLADRMLKIAGEEMDLAKRQYATAREDSTIKHPLLPLRPVRKYYENRKFPAVPYVVVSSPRAQDNV
jgi:hypothetical protein